MARALAGGACVALALLCLPLQPAVAGAKPPAMVLYRYVDSRGVKVLDSQGVPPEFAGKGYEVLNQQGRVIQVVPPAPTAEELQQKQAAEAKAAADAQLLKKYPTMADVDRAYTRSLADIDNAIGVARSNQQALQAQQDSLQGEAAQYERGGHPVPQSTLDQLKTIHAQRDALEVKIRGYQDARVKSDKDFADLKVRMAAILGQ